MNRSLSNKSDGSSDEDYSPVPSSRKGGKKRKKVKQKTLQETVPELNQTLGEESDDDIAIVKEVGQKAPRKPRKVVDVNKTFKCSFCHSVFTALWLLQNHALDKHTFEPWYGCDHCSKEGQGERIYRLHEELKRHKDKKHPGADKLSFYCSVCRTPFRSKNVGFVSHLVQYHAHIVKPEVCQNIWPDKKQFQQENVSRGFYRLAESRTNCQVCGGACPSIHQMYLHVLEAHSNLSWFQCISCDSFNCREPKLLWDHKREKHKRVKFTTEFICHQCQRSFNDTGNEFLKHLFDHHKDTSTMIPKHLNPGNLPVAPPPLAPEQSTLVPVIPSENDRQMRSKNRAILPKPSPEQSQVVAPTVVVMVKYPEQNEENSESLSEDVDDPPSEENPEEPETITDELPKDPPETILPHTDIKKEVEDNESDSDSKEKMLEQMPEKSNEGDPIHVPSNQDIDEENLLSSVYIKTEHDDLNVSIKPDPENIATDLNDDINDIPPYPDTTSESIDPITVKEEIVTDD